MSCNAQELNAVMEQFYGGSEKRYRHPLMPSVIMTEGAVAVAQAAGAYWLLDLMALKAAPIYASAWLKGKAGTGIVTLKVSAPGTKGPQALISLTLEDDEPPAFAEDIDFTDFPEGSWNFYFGTDEIADNAYITVIMIPAEY